MRKTILSVLICLLTIFPHFRAYAEKKQPSIVESIKYDYYGNVSNISQELVESHVRLKIGEEFSPLLADSSIRSLYSSGKFENVTVKVNEIENNGRCNVIFNLVPRNRIAEVKFLGNTKYKDKVLVKKISTTPRSNLSKGSLKSDSEAIKSFYYQKGYPYVEVSYDIENPDSENNVRAIFNISEGPKFRVGNITFKGNGDVKVKDLLGSMRTKKWTIFSFFKKSGVYRPDVFESDIENLKTVCRNNGYLDVNIDVNEMEYTSRGRSLDVCIPIHLEQKYYVGKVSISGNTLYATEKINEVLKIKSNDVFSPEKINSTNRSISDFYEKSGYINTSVQTIKKSDVTSNKIDLEFSITESAKCFVNEIEIRGNSKTRDKVILRELTLAPGDPFDLTRAKNSRARLLNTGYFSSVDMDPVATDVPSRMNLLIDVKEENTGKAGFGGAISTGGEVVGFLEFQQRNFDLHSDNRKFQGGGQKFRSRLQFGKRSTNIDINFEEPWWCDREIAIGTDLFFRKRDYNKTHEYFGANYNESRYGASVYLRKRIYGLWEGKLTYTLENVKIYDIALNAPKCFFDEEGNTSISKLTFSLERDSRDSFFHPTSGSRVAIDTDLAGGPLFGETKYLKFSASAIKHWLVHETAEQVFSLIGRVGTMMPYGGDSTPFFDRFYLGGSNFMKGFRSNEVGPRERGTGIGGNTFAYLSSEYCVKISDPLRVYFFAEAGFVNESKWNFSARRYASDVGIGLKISIMNMPLRLDFGFPIHAEKDIKHGMRFNYSFGVSF